MASLKTSEDLSYYRRHGRGACDVHSGKSLQRSSDQPAQDSIGVLATKPTRYDRRSGATAFRARAAWCKPAAERVPKLPPLSQSNASAASYGHFSPILKRIVHVRSTRLDMDGNQLRLPSNLGVVLATIELDQAWPGMWRVRLRDEHLTDVVNQVNLSRATDAAASLALGVLNRHREAA